MLFLMSCSPTPEITTIISECIWTDKFTYSTEDIVATPPDIRRKILTHNTKRKEHCNEAPPSN